MNASMSGQILKPVAPTSCADQAGRVQPAGVWRLRHRESDLLRTPLMTLAACARTIAIEDFNRDNKPIWPSPITVSTQLHYRLSGHFASSPARL
jgi:hypothetical protein